MNSAPMQVGPYRLVAEIGHGEIGLVYRAVDTLYERAVALKVLRSHVAQDLVLARHFVNAGREAMRLRHPNIVRVYDAGQADGLFYIAMDLVNGTTLETRFAQMPGAWETGAALEVVEPIGAALEYAHRRGLVHHNLKPSNIFIATDGRVLVSDFDGLPARAGESGHPLYYRLKTPVFLAPEQARGDEQVDAAADVYSLAALAYRLLTGKPPVGGGNPLNLLWRIAEEAPKRADEAQPGVATAVADALAAALAKDVSQRPAQVGELVRGLRGAPLPHRTLRAVKSSEAATLPPVEVTRSRSESLTPMSPPLAYVPPPQSPLAHAQQPVVPYVPSSYTPSMPAREDEAMNNSGVTLSPPLLALWRRGARTARRAEPMALPALALLAVAGLAALLLIFAAMRVAGTLIARIAEEDASAGQIIVILPTVTPTPQHVAEAVSGQSSGEKAKNVPAAGDGGTRVESPREAGGSVPMAVVVTDTVATDTVATDTVATDTVATDTVATDTMAAATVAPSATPVDTDTPAPTETLLPTETPSSTPTPSDTATPSPTPTATETPIPIPTATPTVTPAPTRTPAPTAEVMGGHLAYTLWNPHTDRPEIWIWDLARRTHNTPLSNYRQPDFGPNGSLVANGHGGGGLDTLVTMGLFGEGVQRISAYAEDGRPHWSPDGKKVVFESALVGDRQYRLYLQDDPGDPRERPPLMYAGVEIFGRYPIFLSDGRVAFNGCNYWAGGSICGVHVMSTDGAQPTNATGWPGDVPTDNLGSRILFMSDRAGSWDLYSMNPDGSDLVQLTNLPGIEGLATAAPDGSNIAYLTNQDGLWSFYVMRPDGSNIRKLFDLPGNFGRGEYDWFYERISWGP